MCAFLEHDLMTIIWSKRELHWHSTAEAGTLDHSRSYTHSLFIVGLCAESVFNYSFLSCISDGHQGGYENQHSNPRRGRLRRRRGRLFSPHILHYLTPFSSLRVIYGTSHPGCLTPYKPRTRLITERNSFSSSIQALFPKIPPSF